MFPFSTQRHTTHSASLMISARVVSQNVTVIVCNIPPSPDLFDTKKLSIGSSQCRIDTGEHTQIGSRNVETSEHFWGRISTLSKEEESQSTMVT